MTRRYKSLHWCERIGKATSAPRRDCYIFLPKLITIALANEMVKGKYPAYPGHVAVHYYLRRSSALNSRCNKNSAE